MTPSEIVTAMRAGDADAIREAADDAFRAQISDEQLRQVWDSADRDLGSLVSVGAATVIHELPLVFERGDAHLQVAYRGDQIAGLVLRPGPPTGRFGE